MGLFNKVVSGVKVVVGRVVAVSKTVGGRVLSLLGLGAGAGVSLYASNAQAAMDFTNVTVDTSDIFKLCAIILAALGGIWGIKRLYGMLSK